MKRTLQIMLVIALTGIINPAFSCPKKNKQKLREFKMKVIEKLEGYEFLEASKLVEDSKKFLTDTCRADEHGLTLLQLKGITEFSLKKFNDARNSFIEVFKLKIDMPLNDRLATPRLKAFYSGVLSQYKLTLKKKAETKAKIKALEDAAGMPEEPKENPAVPLEHSPREKGFRGRPLTVFCRVKDEIKATQVLAFVDTAGKGAFKPLEMKKVGIRRYVLSLTGKQTSTPVLRYYLMAFNAAKKPVAASGNSATPHAVPLAIPDEKDSSENTTKVVIKDTPIDDKKDDKAKKDPKDKKIIEQVEDDDKLERAKVIVDEPDEIKKAKKAMNDKYVEFSKTPLPVIYVGIGFGISIGLVSGESEALHSPLDTGFGMAMTTQAEIGYMMDRLNAFTVLFQMGWASTSTDLPGIEQYSTNDFLFTSGYRNDMRFILRYKRFSMPERLGSTKMSWRYFWGIGMGGGNMRHQVPAGPEYNDTHFSSGLMLNGHGGAMLCLTSSCSFNLQFEVDYTASFSMEDGNSMPMHLDFILGAGMIF
ncbi:MAG: hypothetical protein JXR95_07040 [Deltaproteobacteria bacterium]|nr:hypothetical protein [Deltaproteobacteria bacterium]